MGQAVPEEVGACSKQRGHDQEEDAGKTEGETSRGQEARPVDTEHGGQGRPEKGEDEELRLDEGEGADRQTEEDGAGQRVGNPARDPEEVCQVGRAASGDEGRGVADAREETVDRQERGGV